MEDRGNSTTETSCVLFKVHGISPLVVLDTVPSYTFTSQFMRAIAMKQKAILSLWHWSRCLQRKVSSCIVRTMLCNSQLHIRADCSMQALACWLLYTMNRKRKAERYSQALQRHRSRLLQIGVMQWIEVCTLYMCFACESKLHSVATNLVFNKYAISTTGVCCAASSTGICTCAAF